MYGKEQGYSSVIIVMNSYYRYKATSYRYAADETLKYGSDRNDYYL